MTGILQDFEKNLRKLTEYYTRLTKMEKEKQQALIANNIQEIERITALEGEILLEVSRLEEERLHWAEFFGKEIGKKAEEITLVDLEESFPTLKTAREELEGQIRELKDLHETNTKLLENAINLVNFTIESLTSEIWTTYSNPVEKPGKKNKSKKINFIDKSV